MKKILLLVWSLIAAQTLFAQKPETIPSYARDQREMSWYKQQHTAWKDQLNKNAKDENAWFNYFKVTRILLSHDESDKRNAKEKDAVLSEVVDQMKQQIPDSYEYNFAAWQLHGNDMNYYSFLEKAVQIDPSRKDHFDYMVNIAELKRDIDTRNQYTQKLFDADLVSSGMMYYNYNTIIGLAKNAILLTAGDNDTYPAWVLQGQGVRKDVKVLNLALLHLKDYREKVFTELGIAQVEFPDEEAEKEFFSHKLVQHLHANSKKYPVYIALTSAGCHKFIHEIEDDLYLTGLAYQYNSNSFDNIAMLKRNFEAMYALDYIDKSFYKDIASERVKSINQNYLVPMIKLYKHYKESGELAKQAWIKEKVIAICKGTENETETLAYLD